MLGLIRKLFETLNDNNIRYCHWKSNVNLEDALKGETDLDLLIDRRDISKFESLIMMMDFKMAKSCRGGDSPSICHYYGMDKETGKMAHLHVYDRLITGGAFLKNYHLPLEDMLLQNTEFIGIVRVSSKANELAVLVIRKILECTSVIELFALYREFGAVRKELEWLLTAKTMENAVKSLSYWLPAISEELFSKSAEALKPGVSVAQRMFFARKMRKCLCNYARYGRIRTSFIRIFHISNRIIQRIIRMKNKKIFIRGGSIVAIVGPEAVGKSTVRDAVEKWLSEYFWIETVHVGKPPSTWRTFMPNLVVPLLRKGMPAYRSSRVRENIQDNKGKKDQKIGGIRFMIFVARSIMVAFDRQMLIRRVFKKVSRGAIVICDRYPTYTMGAMDSSQFDRFLCESKETSFKNLLTRVENQIYKRIPPPDIVINLTVPVEVALKRNISRNKKGIESAEYVRRRHLESANQVYTTLCAYKINTEESLPETLLGVKRLIWECL